MLGHAVVLLAVVGVIHPQTRLGESCVVSHSNETGICTRAFRCTTALSDIRNHAITPTMCGPTNRDVIICCRERNTMETASLNKSGNIDEMRVSERKCEYYKSDTLAVPYIPLIPGGVAAKLGEFPHMTAIGWIDFDGGYAFNCGGTLISSRFVLTAGHCTWDPKAREPEPSIVRLGEHNIDPSVADGAKPVDADIKAIHKHPEYKPPIRYNDIALLEFDDIEFNTRIFPACLWNQFGFGQHEKAIATGWGTNDSMRQMLVPELQKVSLSLLTNEFCDPLLKFSRNRNWNGFRDTQLCAGELNSNKDTCQGDSGAPLQVESTKKPTGIFYVMGIVSFGQRCGNGKPAVYTRVFKYISWIEDIVWPWG